MHILLIYPGGRQQAALLLAGTRERMRVMMPGQADAIEFRLIEGAWIGESGSAVEIGATMGQTLLPTRTSHGPAAWRRAFGLTRAAQIENA